MFTKHYAIIVLHGGIKMFKKKATDSNARSAFWLSVPVIIIVFLVLYFVVNLANITTFVEKINAILSPIFIGLVIAYLLNPIFKIFENKVFKWKKDTPVRRRLCRLVSLFCTLLVFFAIIALLILLIVPQLIESIVEIVTNHEHYIETTLEFINDLARPIVGKFSDGEAKDLISYEMVHNALHSFFDAGENGESSKLAEFIEKYSQEITNIGTDVAMGLFTFLKDFIIGIFIAFYILSSKELRGAQIKKLRKAMLTREQNRFVSEVLYIAKTCFGGYIRGKLLSSLAVGILTYLCLIIFNISDYKLLIATVICITDIIPVFGPFIGAIPSAVIVLMCDPSKLLTFILIILFIQMIEGNIITPKILGESTNISSLAVIITISVMGSLFGIIGMIIGVPVFATVIIVTKRHLEKRLKAKDLPTATEDYMGENSMSDTDVILHKQEGTWLNKIKQSRREHREKRAQSKENKTDSPSSEANGSDAPATSEASDVDSQNTDATE